MPVAKEAFHAWQGIASVFYDKDAAQVVRVWSFAAIGRKLTRTAKLRTLPGVSTCCPRLPSRTEVDENRFSIVCLSSCHFPLAELLMSISQSQPLKKGNKWREGKARKGYERS